MLHNRVHNTRLYTKTKPISAIIMLEFAENRLHLQQNAQVVFTSAAHIKMCDKETVCSLYCQLVQL